MSKTKTIAVSGKGGTGKTTLSALMIRYLRERGVKPLLGIDADPNSNLGLALGMDVTKTIGAAREEFFGERAKIPAGMPKEAFLQMKLNELIIEESGLDLLVMGRPEGAGCYCYLNNILRSFIENLTENYKTVVIDNEAGMEHLSRRTTRSIDALILCSDYSLKGVRTLITIRDLARELQLAIGSIYTVISRVTGDLPTEFSDVLAAAGMKVDAVIPMDPQLADLDVKGKSMMDLSVDSPVFLPINKLLDEILGIKG